LRQSFLSDVLPGTFPVYGRWGATRKEARRAYTLWALTYTVGSSIADRPRATREPFLSCAFSLRFAPDAQGQTCEAKRLEGTFLPKNSVWTLEPPKGVYGV